MKKENFTIYKVNLNKAVSANQIDKKLNGLKWITI